MIRFLLRRAALTIPTFLALMFLTFVMIRLVPGDPIEVRKGERGISPERLELLRHEMGLDQPIWKQFLDYAGQILSGDFGTSIISNQKVLTEFATLFPATLELSLCAMLFAVILGIPAGVIAAVKRGGIFDQSLMTVALTGYSMPIFWWGSDPHPLHVEHARPDAGVGPDGSHQVLFRADDRVHADRHGLLRRRRPEGRLPRCRPAPDPADHRARHRAARRHRPHDALLHARGAAGGLCQNGAREGAVALARRRPARAAQRADTRS